MKRNDSLKFLSQEHHHGLIFASRLKKAKANDATIIKSFVLDFWQNHLRYHIEQEEQVLAPYKNRVSTINQMLRGHGLIRKMIAAIHANEKQVISLTNSLSMVLAKHIRFEETVLFPELETTLSNVELRLIGQSLHSHGIIQHAFQPEFWQVS